MNEASTPLLLMLLAGLLMVIAFSSSTEWAMLSLNRYQVRHRAASGQRTARVLERLLQRPDDWLGVNLVIVGAASVFASQAATLIAQRTHVKFALPAAGAALTIVMIVLGELAPKIYGATHAEAVAMRTAPIYRVLVVIARPVLWFTSRAAYGFLRLFGVVRTPREGEALSAEELRTVVAEAAPMIPQRHRQMLLSILDLGEITVNDIMVPRQEIDGIDAGAAWEDMLDQLRDSPHTRLPVYEGEFDNIIGILHMKRVAQELARGTFSRERLLEIARAREPYFVPEGTPLTVQLSNFQRNKRRSAFVVNEYGDVEGLITIEDILEEIVGEFTSDPAAVPHKYVHTEQPGVYIVNAAATIRGLNRALQWHLPTDGPKTLNGLLLEQLETIPEPGTTLRVGEYVFEVLQTADNAVRTVRVRTQALAAAATA